MPLYDYQCTDCGRITEILIRSLEDAGRPKCPHCDNTEMVKLISMVNFKIAKKSSYSDEFMHNALPFLRRRPETAQVMAEGRGSEEAKAVAVAEHIGKKIDERLEKQVFRKLPNN